MAGVNSFSPTVFSNTNILFVRGNDQKGLAAREFIHRNAWPARYRGKLRHRRQAATGSGSIYPDRHLFLPRQESFESPGRERGLLQKGVGVGLLYHAEQHGFKEVAYLVAVGQFSGCVFAPPIGPGDKKL